MIKAANFPDAHKNRYLLPEYPAVFLDTWITNLIGDFRDETDPAHLDAGQALFAEYGEGVALAHAHPVDQWQIYVSGSARLTRKPVSLVTVQYTDEWVPYGPIEVPKEGFALLALWPLWRRPAKRGRTGKSSATLAASWACRWSTIRSVMYLTNSRR